MSLRPPAAPPEVWAGACASGSPAPAAAPSEKIFRLEAATAPISGFVDP
jgi:hypothetical protein